MEIFLGFIIGVVTTFGVVWWALTGEPKPTDFNGYERSQTPWDTQTK